MQVALKPQPVLWMHIPTNREAFPGVCLSEVVIANMEPVFGGNICVKSGKDTLMHENWRYKMN